MTTKNNTRSVPTAEQFSDDMERIWAVVWRLGFALLVPMVALITIGGSAIIESTIPMFVASGILLMVSASRIVGLSLLRFFARNDMEQVKEAYSASLAGWIRWMAWPSAVAAMTIGVAVFELHAVVGPALPWV